MRARLDRVEWQLGDETIECTLDDMTAFDDSIYDVEHLPPCSHIFEEVGDTEIAGR